MATLTCRERREQGAMRRWGQQRVGVRLRRESQEDTNLTPRANQDRLCVCGKRQRQNASLTSQTTHTHTHTRTHAHICTIHTYAHARVHPRGHIGIHSLPGVHTHRNKHSTFLHGTCRIPIPHLSARLLDHRIPSARQRTALGKLERLPNIRPRAQHIAVAHKTHVC